MIRIKRTIVITVLIMCVVLLAVISFTPGINKAVSAKASNNPKIILDAGHEGLVNTIKV